MEGTTLRSRMEQIDLRDADLALAARKVARVLRDGGLACIPCGGHYRIVADFTDPGAVTELMQAKRRVRNAPVLVFVRDEEQLDEVAEELDPGSKRLAQHFWPGPLTIRVAPSKALPSKVRKTIGGKKTRLGVRVPADEFALMVVEELGKPLIVSSANREKKPGDSSAAQVRKNFGSRLGVFADQGELSPAAPSTVVEMVKGKVVVDRAGVIEAEELEAVLAGA
jgi:L-threonylcarbamoyladenylate synthase